VFFTSRIRRWFVAKRRDLYTYHDGVKHRRADPIRVAQRLEAEQPEYVALLQTLGRDPEKAPVGPLRDEILKAKTDAAYKLTDAARKVFDLKPLNDVDGLTDGEAFRVLANYFFFMESLAEDARLFRG